MAEWFKALVLKTSVRETVPWVRIPPSPYFFIIFRANTPTKDFFVGVFCVILLKSALNDGLEAVQWQKAIVMLCCSKKK